MTLGPMGIERRRPVTAVGAMVGALRGLYAGKEVDLDSESFGSREARLEYERADMEILLAGRGPRMTDLGGRLADGFVLSWVHRKLLDDHVMSVRLKAKIHGRQITIVCFAMLVTTDADLWMARESLSFRLPDSPDAVKEMVGMTEGDTVAIRDALWSRWTTCCRPSSPGGVGPALCAYGFTGGCPRRDALNHGSVRNR